MPYRREIVLAAFAVLLVFENPSSCIFVEGHGYAFSPRSRNWVAHEDGKEASSGSTTDPLIEYCYHCLNRGGSVGACGVVGSGSDLRNYTNPRTAAGTPLSPETQAVFREGDIIAIESVITSHHQGHFEINACPDFDNPTQECFDTYPLEFIEDVLYGAPKDVNYPNRGYLAPNDGSAEGPGTGQLPSNGWGMFFNMTFKLPMGVQGDLVLLQWKYMTGNSCRYPGYDVYPWPAGWAPDNMGPCDVTLCPDGSCVPERFWNCIEVQVLPAAPTVSPAPTSPPFPTLSPSLSPTDGNGCCSQDYKDCASWVTCTDPTCCAANDMVWLSDGPDPTPGCVKRWESCSGSAAGCCSGASCTFKENYYQCTFPDSPVVTPPPVEPEPTISPSERPTDPTPYPTDTPTKTPTDIPPSPTSESGCCSQDYRDCASWVSCTDPSCCANFDMVWLSNGADTTPGCFTRWVDCSSNMNDCCSGASCTFKDNYYQCVFTSHSPTASEDPTVSPTESPSGPTPHPSKLPTNIPSFSPTKGPTYIPIPTESPTDSPSKLPTPTDPPSDSPTRSPTVSNLFSSDNVMTSYNALLYLVESITNKITEDPPLYAVISEGGAAGSGDVVSEGQAYGLLIAGITLASMDVNDANRTEAMHIFHGYFNGWKRMAENTDANAGCQGLKFCANGAIPCLPGWKHNSMLTSELGTGAAPDGDEDAIIGMIFAVKAVENDLFRPSWYDEVRIWADASCTQFLQHNTLVTTNHRLLRLGTCWGGWYPGGQNPSYHSPGSYRIMRDYQFHFPSQDRTYTMPDFGETPDSSTLEDKWNKLIETSYELLSAVQCDTIGLVPNWATVQETDGEIVPVYGASFSGSGTPQYEFGSEASRTLWRVTLDAIAFQTESDIDAGGFLAPIHSRLDSHYDPVGVTDGRFWKDDTLTTCSVPTMSQDITVFAGGWKWNAFIYSPLFATLVSPAATMSAGEQQERIDAAASIVGNLPGNPSYYPLCWSIIGVITLNGSVARAALVLDGTAPRQTSTPTQSPQPTTSPGPTGQPIIPPTFAPSVSAQPSPTLVGCCSTDLMTCTMDPSCGTTEETCHGSCHEAYWLQNGEPNHSCIALWQGCKDQPLPCCGSSVDEGEISVCHAWDNYYSQCIPASSVP